ncbi:MAG: hypothetical protein QXK37_06395 [Candidatus Woesearchaeota archaeon]
MKQKKRSGIVLLLVSFFCIFVFAFQVNAATHLNITMLEVVYQNITFARDFYPFENQTACWINGTINITNPNAETIYDIYLTYINTEKMSGNFTWVNNSLTRYAYQMSGTPGTPIVLHIPELRMNNYTTFIYNIGCNESKPPLNITTSYINTDHGNHLKVLAGYNWTINQSIKNEGYLQQPVNLINITMEAMNVSWNTSQFPFELQYLFSYNDSANVYGNGTSNSTWYWVPNGGTLNWNESVWIQFTMRAPYSVPFTASYLGLTESLQYEAYFLMSNLTLTKVNASAQINFSFEKRISQPSDNELNHNVTWEIRPYVIAVDNITFDLNKVTLWVTNITDPGNYSTQFGSLNKTYSGTPLERINITTAWNPVGNYWYFNYTDGSNATYPPPIVWMKPEWLITNADGQIVNYTTTRSGTDLYMKYIYVINGYWLEVQKNITNIGENQYQINITVENIGNGWTPEYEYVTVYDFVPYDFAVWDMSYDPGVSGCSGNCQNLSVGTAGSDFYGTSYRWNIYWKDPLNSSLGPKFGPDAVSEANYSWHAGYKVNGTGPYKITQLYIVGLDPLKVDGASTSPVISVITGLESYTREIVYISIVAFLIVINVTNLVITHRIKRKLDSVEPVLEKDKEKEKLKRTK